MSPALLDPPRTRFGRLPDGARAGGPPTTLEQRLQAVWRTAQRDEPADCPVCHAPMRRRGAAVHCDDCGAQLS